MVHSKLVFTMLYNVTIYVPYRINIQYVVPYVELMLTMGLIRLGNACRTLLH